MRKAIRTKVAKDVVSHLIPAEVALDEALTSVLRLLSSTIDGRMEANLPVSCGHQAIIGMTSIANLITQARSEFVTVHAELAMTKTQIGLRETSFGDMMGCPPASATIDSNVVTLAA